MQCVFSHGRPKDIQHLVGKTSWQHSLDTTDPTLADARRAFHAAHYKNEVMRFRVAAAADVGQKAEKIVGQAFEGLAKSYGSMDRAVAIELDSLALTVRSPWSEDDAREVERQQLGMEVTDSWEPGSGPIDVFEDERGRRLFKLKADLFETREETFGLVYQELARSLLERGLHDPLQYQVACMAYYSKDVDITSEAGFHAIARAYLKQLAEHQFTSWPADIREALASMGSAIPSPTAPPVPTPAEPTPKVAGRTLHAAFELWKARKGIIGLDKTADEFATAINRFEHLCGTASVAAITPDMMKKY